MRMKPSTIYHRDLGHRNAMFVLAAIDEAPGWSVNEIAAIVGINYSIVFYAKSYLLALRLISPVGGKCYINERGKIALAVWRGKQITAAKLRRSAA